MSEAMIALSYHCGCCDHRFFINKDDIAGNSSSLTPSENLGNGVDCPICMETLDYISEVELLVRVRRYAEDPVPPSAVEVQDMKEDAR